MIKKVGRDYGYKDFEYKDGWADAKEYLPIDFDMMKLRLENGKTIHGWYSGTCWDGLYLGAFDEVKYWKRYES